MCQYGQKTEQLAQKWAGRIQTGGQRGNAVLLFKAGRGKGVVFGARRMGVHGEGRTGGLIPEYRLEAGPPPALGLAAALLPLFPAGLGLLIPF